MHEASNLAGMAFNIAGLGINHSIAHQLGGRFHIPHGLANSILVNIVIDYNCEDHEILKKYAKLVYKTGMVEKAQSDEFAVEVLKTYIKTLTKIMNMPQNLKECGVDKNEFDNVKSIIAENALKDGCTQANRREITKFGMERLIQLVY
ncbi:alcohol dehydrogenase class IV [Clostridium beijerinckii]|nr:iron-containing alcohol dehydrogenase [Clostridium beijerinckii]NRZ86003.1 alcohol dehydrogenase class IV [Clostridium beijerinckii]